MQHGRQQQLQSVSNVGCLPDCLTNFDVHMLTMDELEEILQDRLAQLDVAQMDSPWLPEVGPEEQEDFQTNSR